VVGVSTLDILARAVREGGADIVPVIDAKRALVYSGTFRNIGSRLKRVRPYKLLSPESLLKTLKPNSILLGDGAALYREKLSGRIKGLRFLDKDFSRPNAHNLIELVLGDIRRCKFSDAFKIEPIYLYPKECQIKAKGKR
jgi:tRNA threonylcarbamoyladenosine biosynthesis protein TsaB